jgi:TP901 family phage tail tape measure protein
MAGGNIGDIFLRLLLDDADFQKHVVDRAQKAGDKAGLSMGQQIAAGISKSSIQIGQTLAGIGQNLTKTGRAMTTNLTLPLLAAGGAATKLALDFDTTGRQIVGLTDVTGEELDGIKEKILALGPAVGKGPQELIESFYFIASAGFKAEEAMEVLETSAKAAASGLGETQTIAQVLGGVINAYGRENITAAKAADILTEAVSQGTAEASGLASVIGNVVPGAAALGVSFDQVTAAMAGMTLTGVGVEESATSLIQIFSSLQKPTVQAEEALNGMGLSSAELRRQLREEGLLATLRTLEERFAGNETASAAVFGNIRALRGVTALLTLDSDQLSAVFDKVANSTGRMQQAYDETDGPQRRLDKAMAELQVTAIELGQDVLPMVVDVVQEIAGVARELSKWWRSLDDDTKKQIVQWLAWIAVAGPALMLLGKLATAASFLFNGIGFLAGAKGIPRLISALKLLRVASFAALGPLGLIVGAAVLMNEGLDDALKSKALENLANHTRRSLEDVTAAVAAHMEETGASFEDAAMAIWNGTDRVMGATDRWGTKWDRLADVTAGGVAAVVDEAEELPENLAAALVDGEFVVGAAADTGIVDPVDEALQKAVASAGDRGKEIIDALAGTLADGPDQLKEELKALRDALINPYTDLEREADLQSALANKAIVKNLKSGDTQSEALAAQQVENWLDQYRLLEPGAFDAGLKVPPALQSGVNRNLDATIQWMQDNVTGPIEDKFKLADVLEAAGYDGLAAYVRGLEQARIEKLQYEAGQILRQTKIAFFSNFYDEGYNAARTYAEGLEDGGTIAVRKTAAFVGAISKMMNFSGSPPYTRSREYGKGVGSSWAQSLVASIRAAVPGIGSMVGVVANALAARPMGLATASVPSMGAMATRAGATVSAPGAGGTVTTNYNLNVTGRLPVDDAQDAIWELRRLAGIKKP